MKKQLLLAAFLMGSFFTAKAQTIITSFESSETVGYTNGSDIGDYDAFWSTYNTTSQGDIDSGAAVITNAWASEGDQSLYFPAQNIMTEDGSNVNYAISIPLDFSSLSLPYYVSFDVATTAVDATNGSNFYTEIVTVDTEAQTSATVGQVIFNFDGAIAVADYENEVYADAGTFAANTVTNVKLKVNADGKITYIVNGTVVNSYTPATGSTGVLYVAFGADDWGTDWAVDNITFADGTLGTKDLTASKFSVFPNPANDIVTVDGGNALVDNVSIVDINGRTVKSVKVGGVANAQINVSDLAKGVYVMTISSDKGVSTQKLMKN